MVTALKAPKQVEIGGLDTEDDRKAEANANYAWRDALWAAMRSFVESYIDGSLKKYDAVAHRLNEIWEPAGRPVTSGALKNALAPDANAANRNNFRLEWAYWFATHDEDIAKLLGCKVKPKKTAEDRCGDWERVIRARYSHKEAEKIIREVNAL